MEWSLKTASRSPLPYILLLLFCVLTVGYFWFIHNFEKKPFEVAQGMSPAAHNNPFLAAERYLNLSGKQAESIKGLDLLADLPSTREAIFIRHLPAGLSRNISDSLFGWVESGGHLLMVPNSLEMANSDSTDLGQRIGVRYADPESDENSDCGCPADDPEDPPSTEVEEPEPVETDDGYHPYNRILRLTVRDHNIELEQNSSLFLEDINDTAIYRIAGSFHKEYTENKDQDCEDNHQLIEHDEAWLLQYRIGSGTVTVFSEITLFTNRYIVEKDHAFFLSHLIDDSDKIWLLYSSNVDSLVTLAWKRFPLFWISLTATLLLAVWMVQMRSGPMQKPQKDKSHSILTHIEAIGHYSWRTDRCTNTVNINRRHFLKWWQERKQGFLSKNDTAAVDVSGLAERSGLSEQDINDAFCLKHTTEQDFIRSSRALQKFHLALQGKEEKHND